MCPLQTEYSQQAGTESGCHSTQSHRGMGKEMDATATSFPFCAGINNLLVVLSLSLPFFYFLEKT